MHLGHIIRPLVRVGAYLKLLPLYEQQHPVYRNPSLSVHPNITFDILHNRTYNHIYIHKQYIHILTNDFENIIQTVCHKVRTTISLPHNKNESHHWRRTWRVLETKPQCWLLLFFWIVWRGTLMCQIKCNFYDIYNNSCPTNLNLFFSCFAQSERMFFCCC